MAGDVLGSCGIFVYGCVCSCYSVLKGFLKHGKQLLLNLWGTLRSLCQSAAGINFGLHDHRSKTEVSNRKGEPRLTWMSSVLQIQYLLPCWLTGYALVIKKKNQNVCEDYLAPLSSLRFLCTFWKPFCQALEWTNSRGGGKSWFKILNFSA